MNTKQETGEATQQISQQIVHRMALAYKKRPTEVAKACDELIDRSGNLLKWVRLAALFAKQEGGAE